MPDRYDPKLTVRPPGERKIVDQQAEGDPLAELARIVSGRPPTDTDAHASTSQADVERDLEAELLSDLQASFAALSGPIEAPAEAEEPRPEPDAAATLEAPVELAEPEPEPETQPEDKPATPERTLPSFEFDITQAFDEAEAAAAAVVRAETRRQKEPPRQPRPYEPPMRGPASAAAREAEKKKAEAPSVPSSERPAQSTRPERPQSSPSENPPRRPPSARAARPNLPVRPLPMDDDAHEVEAASAPPPRTMTPRPPRAEPPMSPPPARFAPRAPEPAAVAPPPPRRVAPAAPPPPADYEDDLEFETAELPDGFEGPYEDDFVLDDLDDGYDDDFPPFPDEEGEPRRKRPGRVVGTIAALLAVVAVGGAAVFLYRGEAGSNTPPPIIAADEGPNKVAPEPTTTADGDTQSKLIYDRVEEADDGSRLVTGQREVGDIPGDDGGVSDNPISRVIIPGGPGIDGPGTADSSGEDGDIGPRIVRTVVVKPDGTIVSSEATGVDENGNALPSFDEDGGLTLPEVPRSEMDTVLEGGELPVNTDPLSNPPPPPPAAVAEAPAAPDLPELPSPQPEPPAQTAALDPAPAPPPAQAAPPPPQNSGNGPINLTPGTAPAGGRALVQVTAQRSEEAATSAFRNLQRQFPSILGSFQPNIVRADLGDKGVFYRVRLGPFSDGDAARLCGDLKAAGGDCMIAR